MGTMAPADTKPDAQTPRRPLWQAPTFVLGVAALAAALFGRPWLNDNWERRLERDLANCRSALARPDGDVDFALKLARRALDAADRAPARLGEAAFATGWALCRKAEKSDAPRGSEGWREARTALEQAREAGVPPEDQPRLALLLGKAGLEGGGDIGRALSDLDQAALAADHRVEAYSLITRACLRLQPPDFNRALKANRELRELAADITPEQATSAKLLGGELLLHIGKPDEARATLEKIPASAPPETIQRARLLRARAFRDNKPPRWEEAALLYKEALTDGRAPLPDAPLARFYLGECYRNLEQPKAAIDAWADCVRTSRGPEGLAAGLALADACIGLPDLDRAANALATAAAAAPPVARWDNPHLPAEKYLALFDRSLDAFRLADRHDLILKLAPAHAAIAPPQEALAIKATASAALAAQRRAEAVAARSPEALIREARELSAAAGAAREKLAALPGLTPGDQGEELFRAARHYLESDDTTRAAGVLFRLVELKGANSALLGEAWYLLAEHYREAGRKLDASEAYEKCIEHNTPFSYKARYRLAMAALEAGDLDSAEQALLQNLTRLRFDTEPESRARSLFALGDLLYKRKDHRRVVRYLEDALGLLKDDRQFKDTPELTRARFQLADSYRQVAALESQNLHAGEAMSKETRDHFEKQYKIYLRRAADEFTALDAHLRTPTGKSHLTREQRMRVPFIAARCLFNLGKWEESLAVYERLIKQHGDTAEKLDALGGAVSCHAQMGKADLVRQRFLEIEQALEHVPADVQAPWKDWLKRARPMLKDLPKDDGPPPVSGGPPDSDPAP